MSKYTLAELAQKVDYEGGIAEAIFGYGIKSEDVPKELQAEWAAVESVKAHLRGLESVLYDALVEEE